MSNIELNSTAHDLMTVRSMIAELEAEAEALTDKIKAAMVEKGQETLQGDGWRASWKEVTTSRFDGKAFKAACPELYALYCKDTVTTRFTLNV